MGVRPPVDGGLAGGLSKGKATSDPAITRIPLSFHSEHDEWDAAQVPSLGDINDSPCSRNKNEWGGTPTLFKAMA